MTELKRRYYFHPVVRIYYHQTIHQRLSDFWVCPICKSEKWTRKQIKGTRGWDDLEGNSVSCLWIIELDRHS
jgi:hypothetical protein